MYIKLCWSTSNRHRGPKEDGALSPVSAAPHSPSVPVRSAKLPTFPHLPRESCYNIKYRVHCKAIGGYIFMLQIVCNKRNQVCKTIFLDMPCNTGLKSESVCCFGGERQRTASISLSRYTKPGRISQLWSVRYSPPGHNSLPRDIYLDPSIRTVHPGPSCRATIQDPNQKKKKRAQKIVIV